MIYLTPEEAQNLIESHQHDPGFVLLDLRSRHDFGICRLAGAVNLPFRLEDIDDELKKMNKQNSYLIYCQDNTVSNITAFTMDELGFENVNIISSGITGWRKSNLPVIISEGRQCEKYI